MHENAKRGDSRLPANDRKRHGYAEPRINRPPPDLDGKEGVDGSSPLADSFLVLPPYSVPEEACKLAHPGAAKGLNIPICGEPGIRCGRRLRFVVMMACFGLACPRSAR